MKIKIVQIALAASSDDTWTQQYLDDKGRVWEYFNPTQTAPAHWVQVELPDEPSPKATTEVTT